MDKCYVVLADGYVRAVAASIFDAEALAAAIEKSEGAMTVVDEVVYIPERED